MVPLSIIITNEMNEYSENVWIDKVVLDKIIKQKCLNFIEDQAFNFAEREGFEPPDRSHGQRFSRPPRSTTLPSLQTRWQK